MSENSESPPQVVEDVVGDTKRRVHNEDTESEQEVPAEAPEAKRVKLSEGTAAPPAKLPPAKWTHNSLKKLESQRRALGESPATPQQGSTQIPPAVVVPSPPTPIMCAPPLPPVDNPEEPLNGLGFAMLQEMEKFAVGLNEKQKIVADEIASKARRRQDLERQINELAADLSEQQREVSLLHKRYVNTSEQIKEVRVYFQNEAERLKVLEASRASTEPVTMKEFQSGRLAALAPRVGLHPEVSVAGGIISEAEDINFGVFSQLLENKRSAEFKKKQNLVNDEFFQKFSKLFAPNRNAINASRKQQLTLKCAVEDSSADNRCTMAGCRYQHNNCDGLDNALLTNLREAVGSLLHRCDAETRGRLQKVLDTDGPIINCCATLLQCIQEFHLARHILCVPCPTDPKTSVRPSPTSGAIPQDFAHREESWLNQLRQASKERRDPPADLQFVAKATSVGDLCGKMHEGLASFPASVLMRMIQAKVEEPPPSGVEWNVAQYSLTIDLLRQISSGKEFPVPMAIKDIIIPSYETVIAMQNSASNPGVYLAYLTALFNQTEHVESTQLAMVRVCDMAIRNINDSVVAEALQVGSKIPTNYCARHLGYFVALRTILLLSVSNGEPAALSYLYRIVFRPGQILCLPPVAQANVAVILVGILTNSLGQKGSILGWCSRFMLTCRFNLAAVKAMPKEAVDIVRGVLDQYLETFIGVVHGAQREMTYKRIVASARKVFVDFEVARGDFPVKDILWAACSDMPFVESGHWIRIANEAGLSQKDSAVLLSKIDAQSRQISFAVLRNMVRQGKMQGANVHCTKEAERLASILSKNSNAGSRNAVEYIIKTNSVPVGSSSDDNTNKGIEYNVPTIILLAAGEALANRLGNAKELLSRVIAARDGMSFDNLVWAFEERLCLSQMAVDPAGDFAAAVDEMVKSRISTLDEAMVEDTVSCLLGMSTPITPVQCVLATAYSWIPFLADFNDDTILKYRVSFLTAVSRRSQRFHPSLPTKVTIAETRTPLNLYTVPLPQQRT